VDSGYGGYSDTDDSDSCATISEESADQNLPSFSVKQASGRIFRSIQEDIDSLYEVLLMIIRPDFNRHYLHSSNLEEPDVSVLSYLDFDIRHVEDKIRSWECQAPSLKDKEDIAASESLESQTSSLAHILVTRLARANTKRREQLKHWEKHPDQAPTTNNTVSSEVEIVSHPAPPEESTAKIPGIPSNRSVMTTNTFSTVAVSDIFGTEAVAKPPRTVYTDSTVGTQRSNRVPKVPSKSLHQKDFECPYCHLRLDSSTMQVRQEWKYVSIII
jgi:hypothetical protein